MLEEASESESSDADASTGSGECDGAIVLTVFVVSFLCCFFTFFFFSFLIKSDKFFGRKADRWGGVECRHHVMETNEAGLSDPLCT